MIGVIICNSIFNGRMSQEEFVSAISFESTFHTVVNVTNQIGTIFRKLNQIWACADGISFTSWTIHSFKQKCGKKGKLSAWECQA